MILGIPGALSEELKSADAVLQFAATTSGAKDIVERPYIHVTDNAVMNSYLLRESYEARNKAFYFSKLHCDARGQVKAKKKVNGMHQRDSQDIFWSWKYKGIYRKDV